MTIFFISTEFNFCCGVSRSISSLVQELTKRGHTIILGTPGGSMVEDIRAKGIVHVHLPLYPKSKNVRDFIMCIKIIRSVSKKYKVDVIHTHNRYAELIALTANLFLGLRTVTTSHSMILGKKAISFHSQRIIAPSNAVEKMLTADFKVRTERIRVIRNIPRQLDIPSKEEIEAFKKGLQVPEDAYVIAGIGRLHPEKGFDVLLKGFKICKKENMRLLLAGNGEEKHLLKTYSEANKLNVTFIDEISTVELLYAIADLIVIPSRRDAAPLVVVEAAHFAKPVIASKVGGLPEAIKDGETGLLVTPENPQEIADAIHKLYADRQTACRMGRQLYTHIASQYNRKMITSHMEQLYSENLS